MFNNRHNQMIKDQNGKVHWISRSVVVVAIVFWRDYFLIVRRGKSVFETGKWCLPCGYLDYNETIEECAIREIWEESGVDLRKSKHQLTLDYVNSNPDTQKQQIGFHYIVEIDSDSERPEVDLSVVDSDETTDAKWIKIEDLSKFKFAFNHDKKMLKHFSK